jgi:hypothetical protein
VLNQVYKTLLPLRVIVAMTLPSGVWNIGRKPGPGKGWPPE